MIYSKQESWERFKRYYFEFSTLGLALDLSRMHVPEDFFAAMEPRMPEVFAQMAKLEAGAIAIPDEGRMVGHYWLRNPTLAPTSEIRTEIEATLIQVKAFAADVHAGVVRGVDGSFKGLLIIGIGGSALGPQFVGNALRHPNRDRIRTFFFDNTDPDGMERVLAEIGPELGRTLCLVISKSGGTKETRNGMLKAKAAYEERGYQFGKHAAAVTQNASELDEYAAEYGWLRTFPMWDWVGGRTSELSVVGLLPAALQEFDTENLIAGAMACDEVARRDSTFSNPAALLALSWFHAGSGKGERNMVVIPYKDRLELLGKYLQQLVMESLGKRHDIAGNVVNQGLSVFWNKDTSDQNFYIQQLRDGVDDFFVTLLEVPLDQEEPAVFVEERLTSGDYLHGFFLGTRQALMDSGRQRVTISITSVTAFSIGVLIALFECAVGFYVMLVNINACHHPGVEAGKKTAATVLTLQTKVQSFLLGNPRSWLTAAEIAASIDAASDVEHVFNICERLSVNHTRGVISRKSDKPLESMYSHSLLDSCSSTRRSMT